MQQMVSIESGHIHVNVMGEGKTIVLLPGLGDPCPCVEMKPFAEALKKDFQVITMEPFGYGESDAASTPRTIENISDEIHQVTAALGISSYAIAAHSISGLYSLYHLHRYPEEINAFIALDMSVPQQFASELAQNELKEVGEARTQGLTAAEEELREAGKKEIDFFCSLTPYPFSEADIRQYIDMVVKCAHDPTILDELKHIPENAGKTKDLTIPDTLPALMLIAEENTKRLPEWEDWHRSLCGARTQFHILESDHYVHLMQTEQVVHLIRELIL